MAEKTVLNEEVVKALPVPEAGNRVTYFAGAALQGVKAPKGFGVRVTSGGARSFIINYRIKGREYRYTIGGFPDWSAVKAVKHARDLRQRIDKGENPLDDRKPVAVTKTVGAVLNDFLERYARPKLRGADAIESAFTRLVKPHVGKLGIYELRRSHVAEMLDKIEDDAGPVAADRTRAYFRKALGWYGERDDQFNLGAAIVRVEPRANPNERACTRTLSDDELRAIWPVLGGQGTFGALVKALLLTGQRRNEVAGMARKEIDKDGLWLIPAERYKTKREHVVPLSKDARALIDTQPKVDKCDFAFPSREKTAYTGFGKSKAVLDKAVLKAMQEQATEDGRDPKTVEPLPNWTLHDLRRTAKTLMARAGVRPDVSERVLGHIIAGVEGVYDRHAYVDEKRAALERLASQIDRILNPLAATVESLDGRR